MICKKNVMVLALSLFLVACGSTQRKPPEVTEVFVTNITADGLKLFSYTLTKAIAPKTRGSQSDRGGRGGGKGGSRSGMGGTKPAGKDMMQSIRKNVYQILDAKLEEVGYCREGYLEVDSFIGRGYSQIRGECKEGATDQDRIVFVNNEDS